MDIGFFSYNSDYGIQPHDLAKELEERKFDSLWVGEHTHIPASRRTPFPGGIDLPRPYYHFRDPFISLAAAAAVTEKLKIATGISLVAQHDPIVLAKSVATLDHLSEGRFEFGIGGGWNREEMENHGYKFQSRWKLLRERIEAMKAIWTEEEASYSGEYVNFEKIISYPKPVQTPYPPILMGGATEMSLKRVARYCDGWMPIDALLEDPAAMVEKMRNIVAEEDRDPDELHLSIFCQKYRNPDSIQKFREAGFTRAIIALPNRDRSIILGFVDEYVGLGEKIG